MLDSIYHMTLEILLRFCVKNAKIWLHLRDDFIMDVTR